MPFALSLALLGCAEPVDSGEPLDSGLYAPFIEGRACDTGSPATWESFGQGFLLDHCAGCHSALLEEGQRAGAPLDVNLDTRDDVARWLDRIYARSADENTTMPPVDSVPAEHRVWLGDWLACGAP